MSNTTDNQIIVEKKKHFYWVGLVLLLGLAYIFFSDYGLYEGWQLESEKANIDADIQYQHAVRDSLNVIIKRLDKDDSEIERLARERYGMIKPGEEVLFVPPTQ
ncbi:MAG: Septum formation initiator [Bacteroidota bacterium]|jgi:cell division protein FtsB